CAPARMQLAEEGRQIAVDSYGEWYARSASDGGANATGISHRYQQRSDNAEKSYSQRCRAGRDSLKYPALGIDAFSRQHEQRSYGPQHIDDRNQNTGAEDSAGEDFLRVLNFLRHGTHHLESGKGEGNL